MIRQRPTIDERQSFVIVDGHLVRAVTTHAGGTYHHRCSLASYTEVAYLIEEHRATGITTGQIWEGLAIVPATQASVAVAFMKERSCLEVRHRKMHPASVAFVEDALLEYHALEAKGTTP